MKTQIQKIINTKKYNFWFFQISGWLVYGVVDLYGDSQMTAPYDMSIRHVIAWFLSVSSGFAISLLLRQIYRPIYLKSHSIVFYVIASFVCSIVGGFMWLSVKDTIEFYLTLGMPYSIWSWYVPRYYEYLIINIFLLTSPLITWSFIYFGYKLIDDLSIERGKSQKSQILAKEAQLQMLRYQINPHFLFNSLNSIQALMYKDTQLADEMLSEFSEFFRYTLKNKDEIFVPLEDEIEIISKYLYIEKIRFQEKLNYKIEMSNDTRKIKVLSFLLQPFVENAIKYGLRYKQDILYFKLRSEKLNNWLEITVENSGKWINNKTQKGIGIENVKNRLKSAYPEKHILQIIEEDNRVKIRLQLKLSNE